MNTNVDQADTSPVALLKEILANLRKPEALNSHPWALQNSPNAQPPDQATTSAPGEQLIQTVTAAFRKTLPVNPPRTGKRLDTRWGIFGLLAAQYFAPLLRGDPFPSSLREAWDSLDNSILFFVYGRADRLTENELAEYRFAGNEPEPAANSTLSDWHRKGLEQLAELVQAEQKRLASRPRRTPTWRKVVNWTGLSLFIILLGLSAWLGWQAWNIYQHVLVIERKANALQAALDPQPGLKDIPEIAGKVHAFRLDLDTLLVEVEPYLWLAPYFDWVPEYGGTLEQAEPVLVLAQNLAAAADEGLTAITPAVETALATDKPLEVMDLLLQLQSVSPQLLNAQLALVQAQEARKQIDPERLIPRIKNIITGQIDPLFTSISGAFPMEDALAMVRIAPELLGGGKAGPQTYLILIQNEDELRPTGGFLTAAGSAVVMDGKVISMNIESSDVIDDLNLPFPLPPWQFKQFMNLNLFLLRDSNWFTDFPTTATWAEYFYSYSRATSANGIITLNMHVIARLLETLGPLDVEGVSTPITSENVQEYLRSAEKARPKGVSEKWDRKQFLGQLAKPLLEKILNARGQTWTRLMPVLLELLDEKHILLQIDNEEVRALLERMNWDGAVRIPANSDFLMTVDTNMGYNKTNATLEMTVDYQVNLTTPETPSGLLQIKQTNQSTLDIPCEPFAADGYMRPSTKPGEISDPVYTINGCHWGYLRAYTPADTKLLRANPREIPAESTMFYEAIPARTDDLGSEDIPGAQVFGMMVITPTRQSRTTEFEYSLPAAVVTRNTDANSWTYRLKVQKQPGLIAPPFTLTLKLPEGARIKNASIPFTENAGAWTAQLDLRRDLVIEVVFN